MFETGLNGTYLIHTITCNMENPLNINNILYSDDVTLTRSGLDNPASIFFVKKTKNTIVRLAMLNVLEQ